MRRTLTSLFERRRRTAWAVIAACLLLAAAVPWLEQVRVTLSEQWSTSEIHVTSNLDDGPGSLREAIFIADRNDRRTRIVLDVGHIVLLTPLPPFVNPRGVELDASKSHCQLDASALDDSPVLDLVAARSAIDGVLIEGAKGQAILVRRDGARLRGVTMKGNQVGVYLIDGAGDLSIRDSAFDGNAIGVRVPPDATNISVGDNRFGHHTKAAVWAVAAQEPDPDQTPTFDITRNHFDQDAQAVVSVNVPARIEENELQASRSSAVQVSGAAFVIRGNRILSARGFGIDAETLRSAHILNNEIAHNCKGGLLLRSSRNTQVRGNRLYANGYGVVIVVGFSASPNIVADNLITQQFDDGLYVIGASPVVRANRILNNLHAGVRLASLAQPGQADAFAEPLLEANTLVDNGMDELQREQYRSRPTTVAVSEPADCARRVTVNPTLAAGIR
jgi:parallel beta-helix repeat protein